LGGIAKKEWQPGYSRFPEKNERKTKLAHLTEVLMFAGSTTNTLVNVEMSSISFTLCTGCPGRNFGKLKKLARFQYMVQICSKEKLIC